MRDNLARVRRLARRRRVRGNPLPVATPPVKSYRIVAVSLYAEQANALDRTTQALVNAGYPKANRSLVAQAAIDRLQDELSGKTPEEILRYFGDRHLRRPLKALQSRRQVGLDSRQLNLPLSIGA